MSCIIVKILLRHQKGLDSKGMFTKLIGICDPHIAISCYQAIGVIVLRSKFCHPLRVAAKNPV